jgi:hypothetical protein
MPAATRPASPNRGCVSRRRILILIERGRDNLAAALSAEPAELAIYTFDVSAFIFANLTTGKCVGKWRIFIGRQGGLTIRLLRARCHFQPRSIRCRPQA